MTHRSLTPLTVLLIVVSSLLLVGVPTAHAGRWSRALATDGGYARGFFVNHHLHCCYQAPNNGLALNHLYFSFAQPQGDVTNLLSNGSPLDEAAFAEVGFTAGPLDHTSNPGPQFYWQSCQSPFDPSSCARQWDYWEGPMAPAPAVIYGHTYQYQALLQFHDGGWWWDMLIADLTAGTGAIRGGGRNSGARGNACCSTAAIWGAEAVDGLASPGVNPNLVFVPFGRASVLAYLPEGSNTWKYWGRSSLWGVGAPPGFESCKEDDSVFDRECDGNNYEFRHAWHTKYRDGSVGS